MEFALTASNITFVIGLMGVVFTVYSYFRNPQEELEKTQAVSQKEIDGKASLLAQQVQWEKEANEKKFTEFGLRLDGAMTLAQNHIHTVQVQVETLTTKVNEMNGNLIRLSTMFEERLPKK